MHIYYIIILYYDHTMKGDVNLDFRHEVKHEINYLDKLVLCQRLKAICKPDPHANDYSYFIRSIYFDNLNDKALKEKVDGVNKREKFRIRFYNFNEDYIMLEKKSKINGLCNKQQTPVTKDEVQRILNGDIDWMLSPDGQNTDITRPLLIELYSKMRFQGLLPKTLVDYTRDVFIYEPGNVRITLDYNIRTGISSTDFFNPLAVTVPAGDSGIILEVKWDEYLPDIIRDIIQVGNTHEAAFSKYMACRIYNY